MKTLKDLLDGVDVSVKKTIIAIQNRQFTIQELRQMAFNWILKSSTLTLLFRHLAEHSTEPCLNGTLDFIGFCLATERDNQKYGFPLSSFAATLDKNIVDKVEVVEWKLTTQPIDFVSAERMRELKEFAPFLIQFWEEQDKKYSNFGLMVLL